jgi:Flp pilus assembly protein TadG
MLSMKSTLKKRHRQLLKNESGDSLVEFAVCISIFFTMLFGIIGCSLAVYANHYVTSVTSEAARYAMVRGSTWSGVSCASTSIYECNATSTSITNYVNSFIPSGLNSTNLSVTVSWPGTTPTGASCNNIHGNNSPNCVVNVLVRYSFNYPVPFLTKQPLIFASTAVAVIAQ